MKPVMLVPLIPVLALLALALSLSIASRPDTGLSERERAANADLQKAMERLVKARERLGYQCGRLDGANVVLHGELPHADPACLSIRASAEGPAP